MKRYQITEWCHQIVKNHVKEGSLCIDATAGAGNDTLFLSKLVGDTGKVLAFDIQKEAIERTTKRIRESHLERRVEAICESHTNMKNYALENTVDAILFNFGYLPGGDHSISTKPDTSIRAIEQGLSLLSSDGIMSLCIYSGGDSGFEERDQILEYLKTLDSKKYIVIVSQYYNRPNHPPIPAFIIKI